MIIMTFGRRKTYYDYMECLRLYSVELRSGSRGEKFVVRKIDNLVGQLSTSVLATILTGNETALLQAFVIGKIREND